MGDTANGNEDKPCLLSDIESALVSSLLEDLERQISLLKYSFLKSSHGHGYDVSFNSGKTDGEKSSSKSEKTSFSLPPIQEAEQSLLELTSNNKNYQGATASPLELNKEAELEVKQEYSRLKEDLSKLKPKRKNAATAMHNDNSSEPSDLAFSNNVDYILKVLRKTQRSLNNTNSFGCFVEEIDRKLEELNCENKLRSDIDNVKRQISTLQKDIIAIQEKTRLDEQEKRLEINQLHDEHYLVESDGKETLKATKSFFEAKDTISKTNHQEEVASQSKLISDTKWKIERDVHCLATMEAWTDNFCEKLEEEIDKWKLKLRKDEMLMDMRIDAKRRHIKEQEELMKSLNEIIAQRLEELAPWEEEKEVERQERLAHMRRYYSARKLQRWWRGYMIKMKLYRRRKTKGKQ